MNKFEAFVRKLYAPLEALAQQAEAIYPGAHDWVILGGFVLGAVVFTTVFYLLCERGHKLFWKAMYATTPRV